MRIIIYDHEFKNMETPLFYKKIKELNFLIDLGDQFRFQLPNTDYYIFLTFCSFVWVYYPHDQEPELVSLDDLLQRLPESKAEDILFNLDLFKQEKNRKKN